MSLLNRDNMYRSKRLGFTSRDVIIPDKFKKNENIERGTIRLDSYLRSEAAARREANKIPSTITEFRKKYEYPLNLYYFIYKNEYDPKYIKERIETIPNYEQFLKDSLTKDFQYTDPDKAYTAIMLFFKTDTPIAEIKREVGIYDIKTMLNKAAAHARFYLEEIIYGVKYDIMNTGLNVHIIKRLMSYGIYSFSDLEKELTTIYLIGGLGPQYLNEIRHNKVIVEAIGEYKMKFMRKSKTHLIDPNIRITQEEIDDLRNKNYKYYPRCCFYRGEDTDVLKKDALYRIKIEILNDNVVVYTELSSMHLYKNMEDFLIDWEIIYRTGLR
jgi:hypothetical protein